MQPPPILRSLAAGAERLVDRLLCVAGAVAASQLPEFMQQYLQRLEGHLDEARLQLERLGQMAAQAGRTLDQAGADAGALGALVRETARRVDALQAADNALRSAGAWSRPFAFLAHLDGPIARATWRIFRPAVPTTGEGAAYALAGMVAALALYHGCLRAPLARLVRRGKPRAPAAGA